MLLLLPPSEGKTGRRRGNRLDLATLSLPELTEPRAAVMDALVAASGRSNAVDVLKVSEGLADQVADNITLRSRPATPVAQLYSGVLYDALDLASLDAAAKRRANRRVVVQSALFGALRLTDKVPSYRLSMGVSLPPLGPLASFWRDPLAAAVPTLTGKGLIIDSRSSTYAAAWRPAGAISDRWVQVVVPGATHMAKHTRGLVTRALCEVPEDPRSPQALPDLLPGFTTTLRAPARSGAPWVLEATAR